MRNINKFDYEKANKEYPFLTKNPLSGYLISPDTDGIISAIYATEYVGGKVVGMYDGGSITLKDGLSINDGEYTMLDCELFTNLKINSIGNHCLSLDKISQKDIPVLESAMKGILSEKTVFNPGIYRNIRHSSKNRYPFGTSHFFVQNLHKCGFDIGQLKVSDGTAIPFLHSDGFFSTIFKHYENTSDWMEYLDFDDGPFKNILHCDAHSLCKEMYQFWKKRDGLCWKTNKDGDDIEYVDKMGKIMDDGRLVQNDDGTYSASHEYKEKRVEFIRLIYEYLGLQFNSEKFDIFDNFNITTFNRMNCQNNAKNAVKIYEGVSNKTIFSYNVYNGDSICYTENDFAKNNGLISPTLFNIT